MHYVKPETCDPLHETAQGDLIGQIGAQGCRVRADADLAVVEFRAQRRAHPANESDLVCLCWHHGYALWFAGSYVQLACLVTGMASSPFRGLSGIRRGVRSDLVPTGQPPGPVNW